jgi:hypothetical protein
VDVDLAHVIRFGQVLGGKHDFGLIRLRRAVPVVEGKGTHVEQTA